MLLDMTSADRQRSQPFGLEIGVPSRGICQQIINRKPRKTAEGNLERTRPIDAHRIRIVTLPMVPLVEQLGRVLVVPAESVSLRQRCQMLVPIQFPGNLAVADLQKIEVANLEPGPKRRAFVVNTVVMPIDLGSIIEILIPQQIETVAANPLCPGLDPLYFPRKSLFQQRTDRPNAAGVKEKLSRLHVSTSQPGFETEACPGANQIKTRRPALTQAIECLGRAHRKQATPALLLRFATHNQPAAPRRSNNSEYTPSICSTSLSKPNVRRTYSLPRSPNLQAKSGARKSRSTAAASNSALSGGTSNPVTPSSTISVFPPTFVATIASPAARYSRIAFGSPSACDGSTARSHAARISGTSSRCPRKMKCRSKPKLLTWVSNCFLRVPSPTRTKRASAKSRTIVAAALISTEWPLTSLVMFATRTIRLPAPAFFRGEARGVRSNFSRSTPL